MITWLTVSANDETKNGIFQDSETYSLSYLDNNFNANNSVAEINVTLFATVVSALHIHCNRKGRFNSLQLKT